MDIKDKYPHLFEFSNLKTSILSVESLKQMMASLKNPLPPIDHVFIDEVEKSLFKQRYPAAYKEIFDK